MIVDIHAMAARSIPLVAGRAADFGATHEGDTMVHEFHHVAKSMTVEIWEIFRVIQLAEVTVVPRVAHFEGVSAADIVALHDASHMGAPHLLTMCENDDVLALHRQMSHVSHIPRTVTMSCVDQQTRLLTVARALG